MSWTANKVFNNGKEFVEWLEKNYSNTVKTVISRVHVHHTYKPDHSNNQSTLQLHKNMRNYHVNTNGWQDVAQHITIGKDGKIVLGRNILTMPASATGYNGTATSHPFMFETIGNFDKGNDILHGAQLDSVLAVCHYIHVTKGKPVVFHRECLINGRAPKTCPGSGLDKTKFMTQVNAYEGKAPSSGSVSAPKTETKPSTTTKPSSKPKKQSGNARIRTIQSTLNSRYKTGLTVDGFNGPLTKKALIKGLQAELNKQFKAGLKVDGLWGPKTAAACVTVRKGARGNLTWLIQARLYCLGYDPKGLDGIFGNGLYKAVYDFQTDKDGVPGKKTFAKLFG